jgi:hypothetical protein
VDLERCPLNLVSTIEEQLGRKSCGSGLKSREYGRRDAARWPRGTLYPQKLALTSPTSGGRSVGIVRSRAQATEFSLVLLSETILAAHPSAGRCNINWGMWLEVSCFGCFRYTSEICRTEIASFREAAFFIYVPHSSTLMKEAVDCSATEVNCNQK